MPRAMRTGATLALLLALCAAKGTPYCAPPECMEAAPAAKKLAAVGKGLHPVGSMAPGQNEPAGRPPQYNGVKAPGLAMTPKDPSTKSPVDKREPLGPKAEGVPQGAPPANNSMPEDFAANRTINQTMKGVVAAPAGGKNVLLPGCTDGETPNTQHGCEHTSQEQVHYGVEIKAPNGSPKGAAYWQQVKDGDTGTAGMHAGAKGVAMDANTSHTRANARFIHASVASAAKAKQDKAQAALNARRAAGHFGANGINGSALSRSDTTDTDVVELLDLQEGVQDLGPAAFAKVDDKAKLDEYDRANVEYNEKKAKADVVGHESSVKAKRKKETADAMAARIEKKNQKETRAALSGPAASARAPLADASTAADAAKKAADDIAKANANKTEAAKNADEAAADKVFENKKRIAYPTPVQLRPPAAQQPNTNQPSTVAQIESTFKQNNYPDVVMPEDVSPQPVTTAQDFQASVLAETEKKQEDLDRKRSIGAVDGTATNLNVNTTLTQRAYAIKEKQVKINQAQYSRSKKEPVKSLHVKNPKHSSRSTPTIPYRDRKEDASDVSVTRAYDFHPE